MSENDKMIGRVASVIGPVVDVAFDGDHLPAIMNGIHITGTAGDVEIDVVGVCDTRGIFGMEPTKVPFPEIRLTIRGATRNTPDEIELLRDQLAWRCPVKVIIKESGSEIKETWDITYV